MMRYKGYTGVTKVDLEDGLLFGRVIGLRDVITFQAETPRNLVEEFQRSVDFYLDFCASRGESPERPYSGKSGTT